MCFFLRIKNRIENSLSKVYFFSYSVVVFQSIATFASEKWQSGRMHWSWKPAYREVPGVRIPLSPPKSLKTSALRWFFLCLNANEACFSERIRHKKTQDAEGELVFRCFGTVPLRVLLSEAKKIPYLKLVSLGLQNPENNIQQPTQRTGHECEP